MTHPYLALSKLKFFQRRIREPIRSPEPCGLERLREMHERQEVTSLHAMLHPQSARFACNASTRRMKANPCQVLIRSPMLTEYGFILI